MDKELKRINEWNAKHTIGATVHVTKDNGDILATVTTSPATLLSDLPIIWVESDHVRCYPLNRVMAV